MVKPIGHNIKRGISSKFPNRHTEAPEQKLEDLRLLLRRLGRGQESTLFQAKTADLIVKASELVVKHGTLKAEDRPEVFDFAVELAVGQVRLHNEASAQLLVSHIVQFINNVEKAADRDAIRLHAIDAFKELFKLKEAHWIADGLEDPANKYNAFLGLGTGALLCGDEKLAQVFYVQAGKAAELLKTAPERNEALQKIAELNPAGVKSK
jgi:hypothetical protein